MKGGTVTWQDGTRTRFLTGPTDTILPETIADRKVVVVADETVVALHSHRIPPMYPRLQLKADEKEKTLETVSRIYDFLMEHEADRSTVLVAVGGGIICDTAAFAAATFMRGMGLVLVPTTLLAQVDAAIGGKTAVNHHGCKNLVGSFYQPDLVLIDREYLLTLPEQEVRNGMAETIKHAAIRDPELWNELGQIATHQSHRAIAIPNLDLLQRSLMIKMAVVQADEQESGIRKLLNFGHTLGHVIEADTGISHGEAISVGMVIACVISSELGLAAKGLAQEMEIMLKAWGLPTKIPAQPAVSLDKLLFDKKKAGDVITLILLESIGRAVLHDVPVPTIQEVVRDLC